MKKLENYELISTLERKINDDELEFIIFPTKFNQAMLKTSCLTLKNINYLINEYLNSTHIDNSPGEKVLLVFGLLQGLFVAIDALYSLGKAITMDKLIININSNDNLRDIKHIRNDVVGHPTYRYYSEDVIGFCSLDIENISNNRVKYQIYTFDKADMEMSEKEVNLELVIDNYFKESNVILKQAIAFLDIFDEVDIINLIDKVVLLFFRYKNNDIDYDLLLELKHDYIKLFNVEDEKSSRFLWRLDLIKYLFDYQYNPEEEKYINFLTLSEIKKVYNLSYNLVKKFNNNKRYRQLNIAIPSDFRELYDLIRKKDSPILDKIDILHDYKHPLYESVITTLIKKYQNQKNVEYLINWIDRFLAKNDEQMLYLIGSQLKRT